LQISGGESYPDDGTISFAKVLFWSTEEPVFGWGRWGEAGSRGIIPLIGSRNRQDLALSASSFDFGYELLVVKVTTPELSLISTEIP